MTILEAQRDVRRVFRNGIVGAYVSAGVWLASAACATWIGERAGVISLVFGGMLIFPVTLAVLRLLGGPAGLPEGHPMNELGSQVALVLPLSMPVAGAAALFRLEWFYPAFIVLVGAHYLPFAFLYGMREFVPLALAMVAGGAAFAMLGAGFAVGGWAMGGALLLFAILEGMTRGFGDRPESA